MPGRKLEMPFEAWMALRAACEGQVGKEARLAAILEKLHICTEGGVIEVTGLQTDLEAVAQNIYAQIFEQPDGSLAN